MNKCEEHSGFEARISNLEKDGDDMSKNILAAHKRIDGMKNWVIAGMSSLVLQLVIVLLSFIIGLVWLKMKGAPTP